MRPALVFGIRGGTPCVALAMLPVGRALRHRHLTNVLQLERQPDEVEQPRVAWPRRPGARRPSAGRSGGRGRASASPPATKPSPAAPRAVRAGRLVRAARAVPGCGPKAERPMAESSRGPRGKTRPDSVSMVDGYRHGGEMCAERCRRIRQAASISAPGQR